jgi:hypothetical protein
MRDFVRRSVTARAALDRTGAASTRARERSRLRRRRARPRPSRLARPRAGCARAGRVRGSAVGDPIPERWRTGASKATSAMVIYQTRASVTRVPDRCDLVRRGGQPVRWHPGGCHRVRRRSASRRASWRSSTPCACTLAGVARRKAGWKVGTDRGAAMHATAKLPIGSRVPKRLGSRRCRAPDDLGLEHGGLRGEERSAGGELVGFDFDCRAADTARRS